MSKKRKRRADANDEARSSGKKSTRSKITRTQKRRERDAADGDAAKKQELYPQHRQVLHGYGLSDSTIKSWGCFSIGAENRELLNRYGAGVKVPGIALPILPPGSSEPTGFLYRPDKPRVLQNNGKERMCKYEHPRNGLNRLHVPIAVQRLLSNSPANPKRPTRIVITEGPIKAEVAVQQGITCVALAGVWNFRQKFGNESVPIEDLNKIPWNRCVPEICFDSDAATNPQVRRAELALALWLIQHGAEKVQIVRLPADKGGNKVGLDDYLQRYSAEDFEKLPRLAPDVEPPLEDIVAGLTPETDKKDRNHVVGRLLDEEQDPSELERLFKVAADRTGISRKALRDSAEAELAKIQARRREEQAKLPPEEAKAAREKLRQQGQAAVEAILDHAQNTFTLSAQNVSGRELAYIAAFGEVGSVIVSTQGVGLLTALPEGYRVTEPPPDRSPLTPAGIRRLIDGTKISAAKLFEHIRDFITEHVFFKDSSVASVLALWIMATYCYRLFNYMGYIWLTSLGPQCGKSLLGKILSMLCFNSTPPLIDPTPATVFREIEANGSTLILDEMENLDPEKRGELLSLLNAGFERDGQVVRMERAGDTWIRKTFAVFSPKVVAGINQIPRTLQTRVFNIEMRKKKPSEQTKPFEPDRLASETARLRDNMAIFALRNAPKLAQKYEARGELVPQATRSGTVILDDRLRDILGPLYTVAALVDEKAGQPLATTQLNTFAEQQAGARDTDGPGDYALAAHVLHRLAEDEWDAQGRFLIKTDTATELFKNAEIYWATDPARAKSLLRKIGGRNQLLWWHGKTQRGYVFHRAELEDLVERNPVLGEGSVKQVKSVGSVRRAV